MKKKPEISVCIPAYNSVEIIGRTIKSVLKQSFRNFELIIIDDDSIDNTYNIVKSFKDSRIKYIKNINNIGWRANIKKCYEQANGKYIVILCHDDFLKPNFLEKGVETFEKYPNIGIWACSSVRLDDKEKVVNYHIRSRVGYIKNNEYFKYTYSMKDVSPPSETMLKKDCVFKAGGYNDKDYEYAPEIDLYLRIANNGCDTFHSEEKLTYRTRWKNSVSSKIDGHWMPFKDRLKIIKKYKNYKYIDRKTYFKTLNFQVNRAFIAYTNDKMLNKGRPDEIFKGIKNVLKKDFIFRYYKNFY